MMHRFILGHQRLILAKAFLSWQSRAQVQRDLDNYKSTVSKKQQELTTQPDSAYNIGSNSQA